MTRRVPKNPSDGLEACALEIFGEESEYYEQFARIRQAGISPKHIYMDYGPRAAFELNSRCPIVVKRGGLGLDELADELQFESMDALYEHIKMYFPKYRRFQKIVEDLEDLEERWRLSND